ncbi:hypothetical protein [Planctobacterium marinum]|uniref:hypothetical protein n=1 Tax=Planctobacterium marinum TaxID=1631968 RepID=UPI001E59D376|nr:hypothetical protein [Planctobacterium marinum]MCC2605647.1 hypothetical protein [Planctobacterium marinum]
MLRSTVLCFGLFLYVAPLVAQNNNVIKYAFKAYSKFSELKVASEKCKYNKFFNSELQDSYANLLHDKLLISLSKFEAIIADESDYLKEINSFKNEFDCSIEESDLAFEFQTLFDDYMFSLYPLEMATPLKDPLLSKGEYERAKAEAIDIAVSELIDNAQSIAIGTLHDISKLPSNYQNASIQVVGYEYAFETSYGWKQPPPHKFIPIKSVDVGNNLGVKWPGLLSDEQLENNEKELEARSIETYKSQEIMIIRSKKIGMLLHWEPLSGENMKYFQPTLNSREWEYFKGKFRYID